MDLNNKTKSSVKIDKETGSDDIFALLDEVYSDLEDDIDNLRNVSESAKSVLEENLKNNLDSDDKPLNSVVSEANYHVVDNPTIDKTLESGSSKAKNEVN